MLDDLLKFSNLLSKLTIFTRLSLEPRLSLRQAAHNAINLFLALLSLGTLLGDFLEAFRDFQLRSLILLIFKFRAFFDGRRFSQSISDFFILSALSDGKLFFLSRF